jgi:hypothetical protein
MAVECILERNPNAFRPKIQVCGTKVLVADQHAGMLATAPGKYEDKLLQRPECSASKA